MSHGHHPEHVAQIAALLLSGHGAGAEAHHIKDAVSAARAVLDESYRQADEAQAAAAEAPAAEVEKPAAAAPIGN